MKGSPLTLVLVAACAISSARSLRLFPEGEARVTPVSYSALPNTGPRSAVRAASGTLNVSGATSPLHTALGGAALSVQREWLRWDFNVSLDTSRPSPPTALPPLPPGAAFAHHSAWVAGGTVEWEGHSASLPALNTSTVYGASMQNFSLGAAGLLGALDHGEGGMQARLAEAGNVMARFEMSWNGFSMEPSMQVSHLRVWRGGQWVHVHGPTVCTGVVVGHPLFNASLFEEFTPEVGPEHPGTFSVPVHPLRVTVHCDAAAMFLSTVEQRLLTHWAREWPSPPVLNLHSVRLHSLAPWVEGVGGLGAVPAEPSAWPALEREGAAERASMGIPLRTNSAGVVQLSMGKEHMCALLQGGTVRCWGEGGATVAVGYGAGRLGQGNTDDLGADISVTDIPDIALPGPAVWVQAGSFTTCAMLVGNRLHCWGDNSEGQLGLSHMQPVGASPASMPAEAEVPLPAGDVVVKIGLAATTTCMLTSVGEVKCWGSNFHAGYGLGPSGLAFRTGGFVSRTAAHSRSAVLSGPALDIQAGTGHFCALLTEGRVQCWGLAGEFPPFSGGSGQLGYGQTAFGMSPFTNLGDNETPASVGPVPIGAYAVYLSSGTFHNCIVTVEGKVRCWGANRDDGYGYGESGGGRLGIGMYPPGASGWDDASVGDDEPASAAPFIELPAPAVKVACGHIHSCILLVTNEVVCVGVDTDGVRARGFNQVAADWNRFVPQRKKNIKGATNFRMGPVLMPGAAADVHAGLINAGFESYGGVFQVSASPTTGITGRGSLANSLGDNEWLSQTGFLPEARHQASINVQPSIIGNLRLTPAKYGEAASVRLGLDGGCILTTWGGIKCWGDPRYNITGFNTADYLPTGDVYGDDELPWNSAGLNIPDGAVDIAAGARTVCVLFDATEFGKVLASSSHASRNVACWGDNNGLASTGGQGFEGQLVPFSGDSSSHGSHLPANWLSFPSPAVRIAGKFHHYCIIDATKHVLCWGDNSKAQLTHGTRSTQYVSQATRTLLMGGHGAVDVCAGEEHTCVILDDANSTVQCWGSHSQGQLGLNIHDLITGGHVSASFCSSQYNCHLSRDEVSTIGWGVPLNGSQPVSLTCGLAHTCAVFADGGVQCWGKNAAWKYLNAGASVELSVIEATTLGIKHASTTSRPLPGGGLTEENSHVGDDEYPSQMPQVQLSGKAISVDATETHTCVLLESGQIQCWGDGRLGELGTESAQLVGDDEHPSDVGPAHISGTFKQVSTGLHRTCGLRTTGHVRCWGSISRESPQTYQLASIRPGDTDSDEGTLRKIGDVRFQRWIRGPTDMQLDFSSYLSPVGLAPQLHLVGSVVQWRAVTQVRTCTARVCSLAGLGALPSWMVNLMLGAYEVDLPTLPAAATSAGQGSVCSLLGLPTLDAEKVCDASSTCTRAALDSRNSQCQNDDWVHTCMWPALDVSPSLLRLDSVSASEIVPGVRVPSQGGKVYINGEFWSLRMLSSLPLNLTVRFGSESAVCDSAALQSHTLIECFAPPVPPVPVSAGLVVELHHTVPGLPSPFKEESVKAFYLPPRLIVAYPSADIPNTGGLVALEGDHFGSGFPSSMAQTTYVILVPVGGSSDCSQVNPMLGSSVTIEAQPAPTVETLTILLPPGQQGACIAVQVADQRSNWLPLQYLQPSLDSVTPSTFLRPDGPGQAFGTFVFRGVNLAEPSFSLSGKVGNASCSHMIRVSSSMVSCFGVDLYRAFPTAFEGLISSITLQYTVRIGTQSLVQIKPNLATGINSIRVSSVAGFPVPLVGGEITIYASGLTRHEGTIAADTRRHGNESDIEAVTLGDGVPCSDIRTQGGQLWCTVPPGTGSLSPVYIRRLSSGSATFTQSQMRYADPEPSAVQSPSISAAGNETLSIVGLHFGSRDAPHIVRVRVGDAECAGVEVVSSTLARCRTPSLAEAGVTAEAVVSVQSLSGNWTALTQPVVYLTPTVLAVEGGAMLWGAQRLLHTFSIVGLYLGNTELLVDGVSDVGAGVGVMRFTVGSSGAGLSCREAGGRLTLEERDSRQRYSCEDMDVSRLPRPADGTTVEVSVAVESNDGVVVPVGSGSASLMGTPVVRSLIPRTGAAGAPVTVQGAGFGVSAGDVLGVTVGGHPAPSVEWTASSSLTFVLPDLNTTDPVALSGLRVSVLMRSGAESVGEGADGDVFNYAIPPQPPRVAPQLLCVRRDITGATRVAFGWDDDDVSRLVGVSAWVVEVGPWGGGSEARPQTLVYAAEPGAAAAVTQLQALDVECYVGAWPAPSVNRTAVAAAVAARSPDGSYQRLVEITIPGLSAAPLSVRVRGSSDISSRQQDGPASRAAGPVFERCGTDAFLATHEIVEGRTSQAVCRSCPVGAVCGGLPWEGMRAARGYFRVPWGESGLTFSPCRSDAACPGEPPVVPLQAVWLGASRRRALGAGANSSQDLCLDAGCLGQRSEAQAVPVEFLGSMVAVPEELGQHSANSTVSSGSAGQEQCAVGHTGVLCETCAVGYGKVGSDEVCTQCRGGQAAAVALLVAVVVLVAAVCGFLAWSSLSQAKANEGTAIQKIGLNHMQQVALMGSFALQWPDPFLWLMDFFDTASSGSTGFFSMDCVRPDSSTLDTSGLSTFQLKTLMVFLLPFIVLALAGCVLGIAVLVRQVRLARARQFGVVFLFVTLFMLYTSFIRAAMQLFACEDVGGEAYLSADVSVPCRGTEAWRFGVGVPTLLLFGAAAPVGAAWMLSRRRSKLYTSDWHKATLGFLYMGYTEETFWYESAVLLRKAVLAAVLILTTPMGLLWQVSGALAVIFGASLLTATRVPFRNKTANRLELVSLALSILTLVGGVMLYDIASREVQTSSHFDIASVISVMLTLLNGIFLITTLVIVLRARGSQILDVAKSAAAPIGALVKSASLRFSGAASASEPPPKLSGQRMSRRPSLTPQAPPSPREAVTSAGDPTGQTTVSVLQTAREGRVMKASAAKGAQTSAPASPSQVYEVRNPMARGVWDANKEPEAQRKGSAPTKVQRKGSAPTRVQRPPKPATIPMPPTSKGPFPPSK